MDFDKVKTEAITGALLKIAVGGTPAAWVGSATGSAMTGTTGADGNVTFGLESNGGLYIENRAGGTQTPGT